LDLHKKDPKNKNLMQHLSNYEAAILAPCQQDSNACSALKVAAKDSRYSEVTLTISRVLPLDSEKSWAYTFFALDFFSVRPTAAQKTLILTSIENRAHSIELDGSNESKVKALELAKRLNGFVHNIPPGDPETSSFLNRMDIFNRATGEKSTDKADIDPQIRNAMRDALWAGLIQSWAIRPDKTFSPTFQRWVDSTMAEWDQDVMPKFKESDATRRVWKAMRLKDPKQISKPITFIIEQLFRGNLNRADTLSLLDQIDPDANVLMQTAKAYVQIRFTSLTIQTNQNLKRALGDPEAYRTVQTLREQLLKANPSEIAWARFNQQIDLIREVLEGHFVSHHLEAKTVVQTEIQNTFGLMSREIRWLVSYPNMLPIMYYVSTSNLNDTLKTFWGSFTLSSDTVLTLVMQGQLNSFFNFTNSLDTRDMISAPEVIMSFRNALNTELFSEYQISPSDFLLALTNRTLTTTAVNLDLQNQTFFQDLFLDKRDEKNAQFMGKSFAEAIDFCHGRSDKEEITLAKLQEQLIGYQETMMGYQSPANIYAHSPTDPNMASHRTHLNFLDHIRTDDLYFLDMIEKMRDIYVEYLNFHKLQDAKLTDLNAKLSGIRDKLSYFVGLLYFGYEQKVQCDLKLVDIADERQLKVMQFERLYLRQAYQDLLTVKNDPTQLKTVNTKYDKKFDVIDGVASRDGVVATTSGDFEFNYSKADFYMRLLGYLKNGFTDPFTGEKYSAIAPKLKVIIPNRLMKSNERLGYRFYFENTQTLTIPISEVSSETDFLKKALLMFYNTNSYFDIPPSMLVGPFALWNDASTSLDFRTNLTNKRMTFEGAVMKFGRSTGYDFSLPKCAATHTIQQLNEAGCKREFEITPQHVLELQKEVYKRVALAPAFQELYQWTGMNGKISSFRGWKNYFYNPVNGGVVGILDVYLYMASRPVLGDLLEWPGDPPLDPKDRPNGRNGVLKRAQDYFRAFGLNEGVLFDLEPALNGKIRDLYKDYVKKEFGLPKAIEAVAREEAKTGQWPMPLKIEMLAEPYLIPLSSNYVQPASIQELQFQRATNFIFSDDQAEARAQ
jgi:hypothetical protein